MAIRPRPFRVLACRLEALFDQPAQIFTAAAIVASGRMQPVSQPAAPDATAREENSSVPSSVIASAGALRALVFALRPREWRYQDIAKHRAEGAAKAVAQVREASHAVELADGLHGKLAHRCGRDRLPRRHGADALGL
jgi:hypothetical protein